jgi:hypothetical protein
MRTTSNPKSDWHRSVSLGQTVRDASEFGNCDRWSATHKRGWLPRCARSGAAPTSEGNDGPMVRATAQSSMEIEFKNIDPGQTIVLVSWSCPRRCICITELLTYLPTRYTLPEELLMFTQHPSGSLMAISPIEVYLQTRSENDAGSFAASLEPHARFFVSVASTHPILFQPSSVK